VAGRATGTFPAMPASPDHDTPVSTTEPPVADAAPPRSAADRFARKVLLLENAAPRALISLRGSLVIAAIRCVITYALLPLLIPVIGWLGVVATPLAVVLSTVALVMSISSLRRVWMADFRYRWAYTAFIVLVVLSLLVLLIWDLRTLLG
jgi:hypothetical protein